MTALERSGAIAKSTPTIRLAIVLAALISTGCLPIFHGSAPPANGPAPASAAAGDAHGIRFEDIATAAGIHYQYPQQPHPMRNLEAFGCGCAALDYDDDGWMDILLVTAPHPILYHNRGDGTFEDVTDQAGLGKSLGDWKGCAIGDYDGDGRLDILLIGYRCLSLLRNLDGRRFVDVTKQSGLDPGNHNHWGSSAGFMDLDGSGRMAMVILNYVIFGPKEPQYCEFVPGVRSGCPPLSYKPEFAEMWRNEGKGRFSDITSSCGFTNLAGGKITHGKGLVIAFTDYDNDGLLDFYIGNDGTPAELMHNTGHFKFTNEGLTLGVAMGVNNQAQASMGADWADYNRDGRLDLVNSAFSNEPYSLYKNNGSYFENVSTQVGIAEPTRKPLGFGAKFLDMDNDGYPDIVFANGHVYDSVNRVDPASTFRQSTLLFRNREGKAFDNISAAAGKDIARPIVGRGLATADFDNDGRMDILIVDYEGAPLLLHNTSKTTGHWVELKLRGLAPNRFAYGAKATLHSGKSIWVGEVSPASSYLSSSSPLLHFGLGDIAHLDHVDVRWSDRKTERFTLNDADRILPIKEGSGSRIKL